MLVYIITHGLRSVTFHYVVSSIPPPLGSFGLSTFSGVFCQGATTPPTPIAAAQLGTLPPYSLVHCRRIVWYIAAVRFGISSSSATPAPLVTDLTQRDV